MNSRRVAVLGLLLAMVMSPKSNAAPPALAQVEISYLLDFVKSSGCQFFRNDTWYDSQGAEGHLRQKYDWLVARDQVGTAEEFIEKAATRSSLSGRAYWIRCNADPAETTSQWLRRALANYRLRAER